MMDRFFELVPADCGSEFCVYPLSICIFSLLGFRKCEVITYSQIPYGPKEMCWDVYRETDFLRALSSGREHKNRKLGNPRLFIHLLNTYI